jgi:hypothetical protein
MPWPMYAFGLTGLFLISAIFYGLYQVLERDEESHH